VNGGGSAPPPLPPTGGASILPPFLPPLADAAAGVLPDGLALRAPVAHPVYLPPPADAMNVEDVSPARPASGEGPRPLFAARASTTPDPAAPPLSIEDALASIRSVVTELRRHAGDAAGGDPEMAAWFTAQRPGGDAGASAAVSTAAEEAARHLESVAQKVRGGELQMLDVQGSLREASALALALAALHGARPPRTDDAPESRESQGL